MVPLRVRTAEKGIERDSAQTWRRPAFFVVRHLVISIAAIEKMHECMHEAIRRSEARNGF